MWKKIFACFLCCVLVVIPLVQRSYAAVTTITVVTILILTILTAMGISLVVAEGSKEAFIADKGDSFMSAKGYPGSFADWISGGTPMDVSLKLGTLMVAKAVVDRIKEFVSWLIPNPVANTTVDISGSSAAIIDDIVIADGSIVNNKFVVSALSTPTTFAYNDNEIISDGLNSLHIYWTNRYRVYANLTGGYIATTGAPANLQDQIIINSSSSEGTTQQIRLCRMTEDFIIDGVVRKPGIYALLFYNNSLTSSSSYFNYISFPLSSTSVDPLSTAVIGDYDDLSDLTTTTTEGIGGTTIINNTFYISQDGQALNPSGQSLDDIINALRQAFESDKREVTVTGTTAATVASGEASPNYSDFQLGNLDLSGLGALLTTRFPFSIPWDLVRIFEVFVADAEAPHWSVNLLPIAAFDGVDTTLDLDLGDYPIIGQVSRWFCIIDLCLGLVFATKKLIWTA